MPFGADAVVMQEETTVDGALIGFTRATAQWQSVRRRGGDFEQGEELLPVGTRMAPAALALAAAANRPQLTVTRRPRVGLLATGDELRVPGNSLGADQIVASNAYGLMPMLAPFAERVMDLGIVPDDREKLDAALLGAFDDGTEVIVTTGGASVGDRDYVHDVLVDLGVDLQFWKIAMRPGKPLMFGRRGKSLVFGLPGNPVSSLVTATVLVLPALRALCGDPDPVPLQHAVPLTADLPKNESGRRHFMRGMLGRNALGFLEVTPVSETDSAHTSSLGRADVLIVQPEGDPGLPGGELVEIIPLPQ
jgi:molybdopterin molybdotransferase